MRWIWSAVLRRAAELGVAVEHNAYPDRLDLCDRDLRLAKELGCRIVINTDSHHTSHLAKMRYGIEQLRRAWLSEAGCAEHAGAGEFLKALRQADVSSETGARGKPERRARPA